MEHAATLDLEDFEDSELQDSLERARRQASGRLPLLGQLFGQAQDIVTIVSFAVGSDRVRAGADRAAAGRAGSGVSWRGALQRAQLLARLRPHAGTPRAGLRPADRRQRRDRQGSEDLRAQRVSHRPLQDAGRGLLSRQPRARAAACAVGRGCSRRSGRWATTSPTGSSPGARCAATSPSATSRFWPARSADCARCSKACSRGSRRSPDRRCIWTTSSRSSTCGPRSCQRPMRAGSPRRSGPASSSRTSASSIPVRSAGPCGISRSRFRPGEVSRWSARTAPARRRWSSCWRGCTTPMRGASCSTGTT